MGYAGIRRFASSSTCRRRESVEFHRGPNYLFRSNRNLLSREGAIRHLRLAAVNPTVLRLWMSAGVARDAMGNPSWQELKLFVERRNAVRYRMGVPVIFDWQTSESGRSQGTGFTRDISLDGVYIVTDAARCPPPDAELEIEIILSVSKAGNPRIKATMKALRIEHQDRVYGHCGFSAAGEKFVLQPAPTNRATGSCNSGQ